MCYSEFTDIISAIDDMDADVITFEASRSDLQILDLLRENNFETEASLKNMVKAAEAVRARL